MRAHEFELPRLNEAKSKACGDCFVVAGRAMIYGTVPEMKLVHAYVTGQGGVEGKRFSHAWNEIGDVVFDYSNGRKVVMRREQYYKIGQVSTEPGEYAVYDDIETAKMIARNKHWGPWDLDPGKEKLSEETLDDYLQSIKNRGAEVIGRGNNAMTFTNPDDNSTVIKVMHSPDQAYLVFLRQFCRRHPNNPWLPKVSEIKSIVLDTADNRSTITVWLIVLEKLQRASGQDVKNAVDTVLSSVDPRYLGLTPVKAYRTFDDIKKPLWQIIAQHSSDADIRVFAEFLSQFRSQDIDVSNANVMMRGPQLVFADPVMS